MNIKQNHHLIKCFNDSVSSNADLKLNCNKNFNIVALIKSSYINEIININEFNSENICIQ